ncbi:MAG: polymer-forming cytoskeletal protein [Myxococcota bacterium]
MRRPSCIPLGVALRGTIHGDEDLIVAGRVEGDIHVTGALMVDSSGAVRGEIRARSVTVRGVVAGHVFGEESIRVDDGARMVGDAVAPKVLIVPGALFRGQVDMDGGPPFGARRWPSASAALGGDASGRSPVQAEMLTLTEPHSVGALPEVAASVEAASVEAASVERVVRDAEMAPEVALKPADCAQDSTGGEQRHHPDAPPVPTMPRLARVFGTRK